MFHRVSKSSQKNIFSSVESPLKGNTLKFVISLTGKIFLFIIERVYFCVKFYEKTTIRSL